MFPLLALALVPAASAQEGTRLIKSSELPGFGVSTVTVAKNGESGTPGNVLRTFWVRFVNHSDQEVVEANVMFRVREHGRLTYSKGPFKISKFNVPAFSNIGGAIPDHRAWASEVVAVDYPSERWNTESREDFELVSVRVTEGKQDPAEFSHLYTWLRNAPEAEVLQEVSPTSVFVQIVNRAGVRPLAIAYAAGTPTEIKAIEGASREVSRKLSGGLEPMHMAALNRRPRTLDYALSRGGSVNAKSANGQTPLMFALGYGFFENARWLVAHGARVDAIDNFGTPTWLHALNEDPHTGLAILSAAGANMKVRDAADLTIMHRIAQRLDADEALMRQVASYGLTANEVEGRAGATPLMVAARMQSDFAARWLILHGARVDARDKLGRDVFAYAREGNTLRTERFFRKHVLAKVKLTKANGVLPSGQEGDNEPPY